MVGIRSHADAVLQVGRESPRNGRKDLGAGQAGSSPTGTVPDGCREVGRWGSGRQAGCSRNKVKSGVAEMEDKGSQPCVVTLGPL